MFPTGPMDPFAGIFAQTTAVTVLRQALRNDRVPSAYLFEGPSGVGKRKAARVLAQQLVAPGDPAADPKVVAARARVLAGTHPDVRFFLPRDEGHGNLQVERVRTEILPFAQYAPFEASRAVLIFPDADRSLPEQHPEAASALLKTIEEPRRGVHFVLLAERPDRLLQTIRSRCQTLRFRPLPEAALNQILDGAGAPQAGRSAAYALADGRADRALALVAEGRSAALLRDAIAVDAAVASKAPGTLVQASETLQRHEAMPLVLEVLIYFYRSVVRRALGALEPMPGDALPKEALDARVRDLPISHATARVARIQSCLDTLEWNANPGTALDALLFDLAAS